MVNKENMPMVLREENLRSLIHNIRTVEVMFDKDLAQLYGVETKVFNQAVKRNIERFPNSFRCQLKQDECDSLRSQSVTLNSDDDLRVQVTTLEIS